MDELLDILAHGDDTEVTARIYDVECLSETARSIPLDLLRKLHAPDRHWRLELIERRHSGRFELLVLRIPWLVMANEPGSGLHPLIVADQGGALRTVGFVLPWNHVVPRLGAEMNEIASLSMAWIGRASAANARKIN